MKDKHGDFMVVEVDENDKYAPRKTGVFNVFLNERTVGKSNSCGIIIRMITPSTAPVTSNTKLSYLKATTRTWPLTKTNSLHPRSSPTIH